MASVHSPAAVRGPRRAVLRGRRLHLSGARADQGHAGSCAHLSPRRHCRSVPPRLPHSLPPPAVPRFLAPPHPRQPSSVLVAPGLVRGKRSLTAAVVCILPAPLGRGVCALEERGAVTGTWRGPSAEDRVRERRLQAAQQKPPPPALPAACSGRGCCGPESVPPQRHTWHLERSGESQATRVAGAAQGGGLWPRLRAWADALSRPSRLRVGKPRPSEAASPPRPARWNHRGRGLEGARVSGSDVWASHYVVCPQKRKAPWWLDPCWVRAVVRCWTVLEP